MKKIKYGKNVAPRWTTLTPMAIYFVVGFNLFSGQGQAKDAQDILVIMNNASSVKSITEDELADLFLKRRQYFGNGEKAVPINSTNTTLRNDFRQRVLRMSASDEDRFWHNHTIRTGGTPPLVFSQPLKAVFKLRNGISYVYRSEMIESVARVVLVIPANR